MFLCIAFCFAQNIIPQNYFSPPLAGKHSPSGTFGELRPDHFHTGIDFSTQNKENLDALHLAVDWPNQTVTVDVVGRKAVMDSFSESDISAYLDFSSVTAAGVARIPVHIAKENPVYFRVKNQLPESILVNIYETAG